MSVSCWNKLTYNYRFILKTKKAEDLEWEKNLKSDNYN